MNRKDFLSHQGFFNEAHEPIEEKLEQILEAMTLRSASPPSIQPMLVEDRDEPIVTPLGAIALASGGNIGRTADPKIFTIDDGVFIPGPSLTERLGWSAAMPFSFQEVEKYSSAQDPNAQNFVSQYRAAGGPVWDGWTSVAHLCLIDIEPDAVASLMATCPRSMYDPHFEPPSDFKKQLRRLAKDEKVGARTPCDPKDWMAPQARSLDFAQKPDKL